MTVVGSFGEVVEVPPPALVEVSDFSKSRGRRVLWAGQTFAVLAGRSLAITGSSGAGKSTLLNCIGHLETPDSGTIKIAGKPTNTHSTRIRRRLFRHTVGHLFQNSGLVENWSVDRNLAVAQVGERLSRQSKRDLRLTVLERVGLEGFDRRRVHSLSGGEQQRVALARLLLKRPRVIVADEPSAALDSANVAVVLCVLAELREEGAAIVIATHDETVINWCDGRLDLETNG